MTIDTSADAIAAVLDGLRGQSTASRNNTADLIKYLYVQLTTETSRADKADAERDTALARVVVLEAALAPLTFAEFETTQAAWEMVSSARGRDWIDFEDIDQARFVTALTKEPQT